MASRQTPDDVLSRMVRAVERVRERLLRAITTLASANIDYAVIGANAVAEWVATIDESAVRNTPNVDILVRRSDANPARTALAAAGFVPVGLSDRPAVFLDGPDGRTRQALRLWFSGDRLDEGAEPLPDVSCSLPAAQFRVVTLSALVGMKLSAYRTVDRVHIQDMARVGLIDSAWPDRFPPDLAERLRQILANPDE